MVTSFLSIILLVAHVHFVFGKTCNGFEECKGQTLTGSTACYGRYSCKQATIHAGSSGVNCDAWWACQYAIAISSTSYVSCGAGAACQLAGSITGRDITCRGNYACSQITGGISATNDVYCKDEFSCYLSTINAGNDAWCSAYGSCKDAEITAGDYVYIYGRKSAWSATKISAEKVYVYGYQGTLYATMDSTDELAMEVYQYGYQSGYGSKFYCRSGSTCTVYCMGNGCEGMTVYCETGADCKTPDCYNPGSSHCPTLQHVVSLPSLDDIKKRNKINDENKFDYFEPEERGIKNEPFDVHYVALVLLIIAVGVTALHCVTTMKSKETQKNIN